MDEKNHSDGVMGASHALTLQLAFLLIKARLIDHRELANQLRKYADELPVGGPIEMVLREWAKLFDNGDNPSWTPSIIRGGKPDDG